MAVQTTRRFAGPRNLVIKARGSSLTIAGAGQTAELYDMRGVRVEIFDCNGKPVVQAKGEDRRLAMTVPAAGTYLLRIASAIGVRMQKIVVR